MWRALSASLVLMAAVAPGQWQLRGSLWQKEVVGGNLVQDVYIGEDLQAEADECDEYTCEKADVQAGTDCTVEVEEEEAVCADVGLRPAALTAEESVQYGYLEAAAVTTAEVDVPFSGELRWSSVRSLTLRRRSPSTAWC